MKTLRKIAVLFILTNLINFGAQILKGKLLKLGRIFRVLML